MGRVTWSQPWSSAPARLVLLRHLEKQWQSADPSQVIPAGISSPAVIQPVGRNSLCGTSPPPKSFAARIRPQFRFSMSRENACVSSADLDVGRTGLVDNETKGCVTVCSRTSYTLVTWNCRGPWGQPSQREGVCLAWRWRSGERLSQELCGCVWWWWEGLCQGPCFKAWFAVWLSIFVPGDKWKVPNHHCVGS